MQYFYMISIPCRSKFFLVQIHRCVLTYILPLVLGHQKLFLAEKWDEVPTWPLKMRGTIPLLPLYSFMACTWTVLTFSFIWYKTSCNLNNIRVKCMLCVALHLFTKPFCTVQFVQKHYMKIVVCPLIFEDLLAHIF